MKSSMMLIFILPSGEMFSNAHHLVLNGGHYYSGQIILQQPTHQGKYLSLPFVAHGKLNLLSESQNSAICRRVSLRAYAWFVLSLDHHYALRAGLSLNGPSSLIRSLSKTSC